MTIQQEAADTCTKNNLNTRFFLFFYKYVVLFLFHGRDGSHISV